MDVLHDRIAAHARTHPARPAILAPHRPPLTYGELAVLIEQVAALLRAAGIGPRDRVALALPEGADAAVWMLATSLSAVAAPLNPDFGVDECRTLLRSLNVAALIAPAGDGSAVRAARANGIRVVEVDRLTAGDAAVAPTKHAPSRASADAPALLLFTSGTSARPKLVPLSHRNLFAAAESIRLALELTDADRCLGVMPLYHIHGLSTLFATLLAGGSYVGPGTFAPETFYTALRTTRPTWYSASPTIHRIVLEQLSAYGGNPLQCGLRFIRSASAPMPPGLIAEVERAFGVAFIEAYGMTEAGPQIASNRLPPAHRKLGSVGASAGPEVAIMNDAGQLLPRGEIGEIVIRGDNVTAGYLDDAEANQATFVDGWFRTGDLGRLDENNDLFITGRSKDVINRGGEKISPKKVDDVLLQHPAVAQAATFAVPHAVLGEDIAAAVVLKTPTEDPKAMTRDIRKFAASRLAPFEMPHGIVFVDALPVGTSGKLVRSKLAEVFGPALAGRIGAEHVAPRSTTERRVARTVAEVLKVEAIGVHDDFFALGGHSLAAMQVVARLRQAFHVTLPMDSLFHWPTVAELSVEIGKHLADLVADGTVGLAPVGDAGTSPVDDRIPRRAASTPAPLSFPQQRLYFIDLVGCGTAYNMSASLRLAGPLEPQIISKCLAEIMRRHASLRTTFRLSGDVPVQVVGDPAAIGVTDLPFHDLSTLPTDQRHDELSRLIAGAGGTRFDLAAGPLIRASLVRVAADDHVLLLHTHHIVSDGWSVGVLHAELRQLYEAFVAGRASPLEPLRVQYDDFAEWQRGRAHGATLARELPYWTDQLRGAPQACTFPPDRPRPPVQSYRGATVRATIAPPIVERLRAIGEAHHATPFMTFLAAFKTLLSRYNGQEDCLVGVPIANRSREELEPLIGFFANTLVLRTSLAADPSFPDLLARVRASALGAFAHKEMPIERIVDELHTARDPSHSPLFQVMFAFQNLPDAGGDANDIHAFELAAGVTARPLPTGSTSAKFDLTLYLREADGGAMATTWQYNTDLYDSATIARVASQFNTLLAGIVADPQRRLSDLPLMTQDECRRVIESWNPPVEQGDLPGQLFLERFAQCCRERPLSTAVIGGDRGWTYAELDQEADRIARLLKCNGVGAGNLVGVCLPRDGRHVAALVGVWKARAAFLGLDADYPVQRIAFMLADAGASIVLTDDTIGPRFEAIANSSRKIRVIDIAATPAAPNALGDASATAGDVDAPAPGIPADSLAYVIYTSGSTGRPKGVMITHGNVGHYLVAMLGTLGLTAADRYLHTASFAFSSSVRQFALPLACGGVAIVAPAAVTRDPQALFEFAKADDATVIDLVPSMWSSALQVVTAMDPAARLAILDGRLRLALSASEPLPWRVASAWRAVLPPRVRQTNMFGQTETSGIVTTYALPAGGGPSTGIVPLGRPIANTQAYILDAARRVVAPGIVGELYIGGAGVGRGYINQPELTARNFIEDPIRPRRGGRLYRTGDLARHGDDGVIEIAGRSDGQIKVRGFRIEPGEIESVATMRDGVRECAVIATTDPAAGDAPPQTRLQAYVAPITVDTANLREFLKQRLPSYMVPQAIHAIDQLPRTTSGKIDRAALQAAVPATRPAGSPVVESQATLTAPHRTSPLPSMLVSDDIGQILAAVWKQVLHVERVGPDENFFDLGGNSLISIGLVVRARQAGLHLTLEQLYQHQTIGELSRVVGRLSGGEGPIAPSVPSPTAAAAPVPAKSEEPAILVTAQSLRAYGVEAMTKAGLDPAGVDIVTDVQLEASLRDQPTHNMVSIPRYAKRLVAGQINARPKIRIEHETDISARVDGDDGPGQWVSTFAMDVAIRKATARGVGIVSVRRSNHFGAAGQYVWNAAEKGLIGLCTTNGPLILAPTGGTRPTFGNNPIGVGIPSANHFHILLDIAMSVAPRGRIGLVVHEGKPLTPGWILDAQGRPSTNLEDLAAGLGVPIGGHKGYGLALVMEILAGALSGAGYCDDHHRDTLKGRTLPPDYGHLFMAIDPKLFMPAAEFAKRVDHIIEQTKSGPLAEGATEILIPGEMELRARSRSLKQGVRLRASTYRTLISHARDAGLATRLDVVDGREWDAKSKSIVEPIPFDRDALDGSIPARFAKVAERMGNGPALGDERTTWTYAALDRRTNQIAAAIIGRVPDGGEREGDCVAYLTDHSADMVVCALATLKAGRAYLCIHPGLPIAAQREVMDDASPSLLLTNRAMASVANELAGGRCEVLVIETIGGDPVDLPAIAAAAPAAIFYTSGSTGRPKGVVKSHRTMLHRAWLSASHDGVRPGDRQSLLTYCSFASSEADVFGALLNGATVELFDAATHGFETFADWIGRRGVTLLHPPVAMLRRFLGTLSGAKLFPKVRLVALAGESVTPADIRQWRQRFHSGCVLKHRFSSTEAGHVAVASLVAGKTSDVVPLAAAVEDKHLSIVDEVGRPVETGVAGELVVRSAFLATGYWRRESAKFADDPNYPGERVFHTGDLGRLHADGRFEFLGRRDGQVKVRGYRVELREVEHAIADVPGVKEAAVVARRQEQESQIIAFVVPITPATLSATALREVMQARLPAWKIPAEFRLLATLPLTLTGKIDRTALLDLPADVAPVPADALPTKLDAVVAELLGHWHALLGRTDVGPDDHFFDVGGHSLLAAELMDRLGKRFGRSLPVSMLVAAPTVRQLAEAIRNGDSAERTAAVEQRAVLLRPGDGRAPLFFLPPAAGTALTYLPLARLLDDRQPAYALLFDDAVQDLTLEELAAGFVPIVRRAWPRGPYRLCGHSYGALLAYEVARQLRADGAEVDFVALLDAKAPGAQRPRRLDQRLLQHAASVARIGPRAAAGQWVRRLRDRLTGADSLTQRPAAVVAERSGPTLFSEAEQWRLKLFRAYRPQRYAGEVTLLRAEVPFEWERFLKPEPFYGWDAVCDGVDARVVPGDHLTVLEEPNLGVLAGTLNDCLRRRDMSAK